MGDSQMQVTLVTGHPLPLMAFRAQDCWRQVCQHDNSLIWPGGHGGAGVLTPTSSADESGRAKSTYGTWGEAAEALGGSEGQQEKACGGEEAGLHFGKRLSFDRDLSTRVCNWV